MEHDPELMCSKLAPVDYHPELLERDGEDMPWYVAEAPRFAEFVAEITLGRRDLARYLQLLYGYGSTGHAREQVLPMFIGRGENGKGVLMRSVAHVLGQYYQSAPPQLIIQDNKQGSASPEVARLYGARLLEVEETDDGDRLHESKVKWLTGGDRLVARHLFSEYFEFDPTFTAIVVSNHKPKVRSGGKAVWRRLRVVPFDFEPTEVDTHLEDRLRKEAAGILAWVVEGSRDWYRHGLPASETVEAASAAYKSEEDRIEPFLEEATISTGQVRRATLYKAYRKWAESEGETPMSSQSFNSAMRERGFEEVRKRTYGDISLKPGWE
jgi:putative DNA primase/helicase